MKSRSSETALRYTWRKLSSAKWEDVWPERLSEFADRLAITTLASAKTIRLEIFELSKNDAGRLIAEFGGSVVKQTRDWLAVSAKARTPLNIRGRLFIVSEQRQRAALKKTASSLIIPAGMAFGTGEHATTMNCLRFVADIAAGQSDPWSLLDLGCGSGILAMAARRFGAAKVEAADFDPNCVRIAKENVELNGLRGITVRKLDVLQWQPKQRWHVITANLYSTILVQIAAKLTKALASGGTLVFSGVMRGQEREVVAAFREAGLRVGEIKRQGKWIAGIATR
jgi:ribosomal protein L11 methyltransferase